MRFRLYILLILCTICCASPLLAQTAAERTRISKLESQLNNSTETSQIAILCDIADIYSRYDYAKAIEYLEKAEKICSKFKVGPANEMMVWRSYGNAYYFNQNYKKAVNAYEKETALAVKAGTQRIQSYSLYNTGVAYLASKNYRKSLAVLNKSLALAKTLKDNALLIKNYQALYEVSSANKDYKEAALYYKLYVGTLTGNSPKLNPSISVLPSNYRGEPRLRLLSESELKDQEQRIVEMDSVLSEQSQHYHALELESQQLSEEILQLNQQAVEQDSLLSQHRTANMKNEMLISEQRRTIALFWILGLILVSGLLIFFFMWQKIRKSKKILENQKFEIENQKNLIQVKNDQITDSINYARKIQDSILVPESKIRRYVPDMFIYFKPKDIVSGDFYWFSKQDSKYVITAIDCTGHGVPGAFLSMVGNTLLHEIVNIKHVFKPDQILAMLHTGIMLALNQDSEDGTSEDGMDMSLCTVDTRLNRFQFAGAKNSLYVVQGDKLKILKANYYSIGGRPLRPDMNVEFTCYDFMYDNSTSIYMFSDGYLDQFGGDTGEKFNTQRFKEMILENRGLSMEEQKEVFTATMEQWKGSRPQIDDFLVMGIRLACINGMDSSVPIEVKDVVDNNN